MTLDRCSACPVLAVEHARATSSAGRLLDRIMALDLDTERFSIPWSDVTAEEAQALHILAQERKSREHELSKRKHDEWEHERIMREGVRPRR